MSANLAGATAPLSPRMQALASRVDRAVFELARHWVLFLAMVVGLILALASAAPVLRASGAETFATLVYLPFRFVCHQQDERSFHLVGEQLAFCQRDTAIFAGALCTLTGFAILHRRQVTIRPLALVWAVALTIPIAIDGGTQLVGLRESTPALRVVTGALFSLGWLWLALPHLANGFEEVRRSSAARVQHRFET